MLCRGELTGEDEEEGSRPAHKAVDSQTKGSGFSDTQVITDTGPSTTRADGEIVTWRIGGVGNAER